MNFRRIICSVLCALLLCICLSPAAAAGNWTSVRSKNFFLAGDAGELEMRAVATRLEQFRDAFGQLFPRLKLDSGISTNVIVFRDSRTYRPLKPKRPDGTPDDAVSGYLLPGEDVNYITLAIDGGNGDPYQTIYHEYVHFLLRSNVDSERLPTWLDEGIAQYYETLRIVGDQQVSLGAAPDDYLRRLRRSELIPLASFFTTDDSALHGRGDDPRSLFYAQSWALVHYLIQNDKGSSDDRFDRFFSLLKSDEAPEKALQNAFKIEYGTLEKTLRSYINTAGMATATEILPKKITPGSDLSVAAISDAQTNAYLGDLLYHADRLEDAEPYLRKAIALDAGTGLAHASLGQLLMRRDKFAEAKKHLETAIARDRTNHLAYFNYAYAMSRESEDPDRRVSEFRPETARAMRAALERAIEVEPRFAESYRLLAFLNFINDEKLDEATSLLRKGLSLKPGDQDFEILLAQVLLAQQKYDEAKSIAGKLAKTAKDARVRAEAEEVLRTVRQYVRASIEVKAPGVRLPWMSPLLFLKRSWLTEADLAAIDRDRQINNLNRILEKPAAGEKQIVGVIERVRCSDGEIRYSVKADGKALELTSNDFESIRMAVLLDGQATFQIDCGVSLTANLAVLAVRPPTTRTSNGILTSITFVPDFFRLKTREEMASARAVVVEDDTLRTGRGSGTIERIALDDTRPDARWAAIAANLRRVQKGETRALGTLESIECKGETVAVTAIVDGKGLRLSSVAPSEIKVGWFGPGATQISLACGGEALGAHTLFTFSPAGDTAGGELRAMEFVPAGFDLQPSRQH